MLNTLTAFACSEGDRLSGLIVDVLGETLVVASSSAWVEKHRPVIVAGLQQETGDNYKYYTSQPCSLNL